MKKILHTYMRLFLLLCSLISISACTKAPKMSLNELDSLWNSQIHKGKLMDAERTAFELLEAAEYFKGKESREYAGALNRMGLLKRVQGKDEEAIEWFRKELQLEEKLGNKKHPSVGLPLLNIGMSYRRKGDYPTAIETLRKALDILARDTLYEVHYVNTYHELIGVYLDIGQYDSAKAGLADLGRVKRIQNVEDTSQVVSFLTLTAAVAIEQKETEKADTVLSHALALSKKAFGTWSGQTAAIIDLSGRLFNEKKDYPSAEHAFLFSLRLKKQIYGDRSDEYAMTLNNISMPYMNTGAYTKADSVLEQAASIYRETIGNMSGQMAMVYRNKASIAILLNNFQEAEKYRLESLRIFEKVTGKTSPRTLTALESLYDLYSSEGRIQEATAIEMRIRRIKALDKAI